MIQKLYEGTKKYVGLAVASGLALVGCATPQQHAIEGNLSAGNHANMDSLEPGIGYAYGSDWRFEGGAGFNILAESNTRRNPAPDKRRTGSAHLHVGTPDLASGPGSLRFIAGARGALVYNRRLTEFGVSPSLEAGIRGSVHTTFSPDWYITIGTTDDLEQTIETGLKVRWELGK